MTDLWAIPLFICGAVLCFYGLDVGREIGAWALWIIVPGMMMVGAASYVALSAVL